MEPNEPSLQAQPAASPEKPKPPARAAKPGRAAEAGPRSRFSRAPKGGLELGERDESLLCDLFLHRALTREQIRELHFGSVPRCNARLRKLYDFGYVHRHYLALSPWGSPAIYFPAAAAGPAIMRELSRRELEVEPGEVQRVSRVNRAPAYLEHTLALADFFLRLRRSAAEDASPALLDLWLPECLCRHEYDIREPGGSRWVKEVFKPDAFLRLARAGARAKAAYFVEVDLGHVSSALFLAKWLSYKRYLESGLYADGYGEGAFAVLVVTTGAVRLRNLRALVEEQGAAGAALPFLFATYAQLAERGPLAAEWQRAGSEEAVRLGEPAR